MADIVQGFGAFVMPSQQDIVRALQSHRLTRFRTTVRRAFLVGSFAREVNAKAMAGAEAAAQVVADLAVDVDVLLEVLPHPARTAHEMEEGYRSGVAKYLDCRVSLPPVWPLHPEWRGRRIDYHLTYDADAERQVKIPLPRESGA